jgi:hypothetical protein
MDVDAVGLTAAPFAMEVERGKIREFATAVRAHDDVYFGQVPVIPATFLVTQAFWATGEADVWQGLDLDWDRCLHGEQEFVFHGEPPRAGARLVGHSVVEDVVRKQGRRGGPMTLVVVRTDYRDDAGELVAASRTTIVETARTVTRNAVGSPS